MTVFRGWELYSKRAWQIAPSTIWVTRFIPHMANPYGVLPPYGWGREGGDENQGCSLQNMSGMIWGARDHVPL